MLTLAILQTLIRCSLICLYLRLLGASRSFAIASYTLMWIIVAGGAASLLVAAFRCSPIQAAWKPEISHEYCIDLRKYTISATIANSVLDFAVLIVPVTMLGRLQGHSTKFKMAISAVFMVGTLPVPPCKARTCDHNLLMLHSTCVASVLRSVASISIGKIHSNWEYLPTLFWTFVEVNLALVCSCLPAMIPLAQAIMSFFDDAGTAGKSAVQSKLAPSHSRQLEPKQPFSKHDRDSALARPQMATRAISNCHIPGSTRNSNTVSLRVIQLSGNSILQVADKELIV